MSGKISASWFPAFSRRRFLLSGSGGALGTNLWRRFAPAPKENLLGTRGHLEILASDSAGAPAHFGVLQLRLGLEQSGFRVCILRCPGSHPLRLLLRPAGSRAEPGGCGLEPAIAPESHAITPLAPGVLQVEGSDPAGLMYGALDLAEQIQATGPAGLVAVGASRKSPYLQIRGINLFLLTQEIDAPASSFWSEDYWRGLLAMMARNRYNFLDLQGPCDGVTVEFPNAYSYFVGLSDFPGVGVGPERAARNLAQLQKIVRLAGEHGIHVGFMNYSAAPTLGPWKPRRFGVDQRWTPEPQRFLRGPRLIPYTRQAVAAFLQALPELWMFGFRIGESGQPSDFYRQTYLAALSDAPAALRLYVRTWLTAPEAIRRLGRETRHPLYLEIKYNGEHLGQPYQAVLGPRNYPPSGSYENYTNYPRDYSILWQIRAHGTHRVFSWSWPEFARRAMRSCRFGEGVGFSMEPMDAYCPASDYLHHNPETRHDWYRWMYEREWAWHLVWGRCSYDPDTPDQVWEQEFQRHFGAAAPAMFGALSHGSRVVPMVFATHNVGLDHQNYAPEFEAGDHALNVRGRFWQGQRLVPYGGDNTDFLQVPTLDPAAMASPADYVRQHLAGQPCYSMSPFAAAAYLGEAAAASLAQLQAARRHRPAQDAEFQCFAMDIEATAYLGRYYQNRLLSATHLEFYRQTYYHPALTLAYQYIKLAAAEWDGLARITERHYGWVPEYIRMGVRHFHWRDEGRGLGADMEQIDNLEAAYRKLKGVEKMVLGHIPRRQAEPGRALRLIVAYPTIRDKHEHLALYYRSLGQSAYRRLEMRLENEFERTWSANIPAAALRPGWLEYYFVVEPGISGHYGSTLEKRPPYRVRVTANRDEPVIQPAPPPGLSRGQSITLEARVRANSELASVRLCYKRMPSYYDWIELEMRPTRPGFYAAQPPLTPEGLLYYFTALDRDGNAARFPNFLETTPYRVIPSWNPGQSG